ncbi:hypothetical protein EDB87DRAFT_1690025 [Lactarius vividus]|nr:hypothetical protein EDB87DRAFT_1690025 [Lactarius vividus]
MRALRQGERTPKSSCWDTPAKAPRKPGRLRGEDSEDDFVSTTEASASDDEFSLDDDDDDDEPPSAERRAVPATTKKATFETSESSPDVDIANDPAVQSDDEDSEDDLVRAAPAKGKGKAVQAQAGKRRSLDEEEDSDAYTRPVKKTRMTVHATTTVSSQKNPAGAKLASKTTTMRKASGSAKAPPKKTYGKAVESSDDEF